MSDSLDRLCVDTIRTLSIDAIQRANSGHPGLPLGAAPMAWTLWGRHLKHDPQAPDWPDRDRFVLSAGHGSMLLYSLLHLTGYDLPLSEIEDFRQWQSLTPGHPEFHHTAGVEATTGPLGQGCSNSVGMAMAESWLAERYNTAAHSVVNHRTWALVGDGDLMEGIAYEAASLAGHLGLGKLTWLYDANDISLDGPLDLSFREDVAARFEAQGWHVQTVLDGDNDLDGIDAAIANAVAEPNKPSLIVVKTTIGYGAPNKAGTADAHGAPLGDEEIAGLKRALGWDPEKKFFVPDEALAHFRAGLAAGAAARTAWQATFDAWAAANPELAREWTLAAKGELPTGWDAQLPVYEPGQAKASRVAGYEALNAIAPNVPWLVGGDADLSCSTKTAVKGEADFGDGAGRNIHYGVREHAMGAVANGIAYHGGMIPYTATFFVFSDYMKPALRLAAMNRLGVINVFTHDSVGVGEDGPTHQPIEHLAALRATPGLWVVRPGDPNETSEAWRLAVARRDGPTALVFSRQNLAVVDRAKYAPAAGLVRGAYVLADLGVASGGAPDLILIGTGSELELVLAAGELLEQEGLGVRVVSMPCQEAFEAQDEAYRESVLPSGVTRRLAVECGATQGWHRYVGFAGDVLGIDHYGASAPGDKLMAEFGFTVENVAQRARQLAAKGVTC